jgi:uncharacterized membrane protein YuzA (DUF378 family)
MAKMSSIDWIVAVLVIVGALNWGLVGLGGWNLVNLALGSWAIVERVVYVLVGLAGLWMIYTVSKN